MHIESIQVGTPAIIAPDWTTAIYKTTVQGRVLLSKSNLDGDKQADLNVHGGSDKAVNVYPVEHYKYWNQRARFILRKRLNLHSYPNGSFGENFTVSGCNEKNVYIGDVFEIGTAIVQISQPRQPCWKLARKLNQPKLPFWVQRTGKTGWYLRVLQEGEVGFSDNIKLVESGCCSWSVERANYLMHSPARTKEDMGSILACTHLSASWRRIFEKYINAM